MPKKKTDFQKALGKLISAIQKEWGDELGYEHAEFSQNVMDSMHQLLQVGDIENVQEYLGPLTLNQYLGEVWLRAHPNVKPRVDDVEKFISKNKDNLD